MPKLEQLYGHMRSYSMRPRSLEGVAASLTRLYLNMVAFESDWSPPHLPLLRHLRLERIRGHGCHGLHLRSTKYLWSLEQRRRLMQ
jgi:lysozyme family protein